MVLMTGLSTALMTPKMTATASSVSAFDVSLCPATTIPGTAQAATPSAAADTTIPIRIFMALFLPDRGLSARRRSRYPLTFQCRPAALSTLGTTDAEPVSAGSCLPPTLSSTVSQPPALFTAASTGPPAFARNVSSMPLPNIAGQLATPSVETGSASMSAAICFVTAGSVIVTGAGGRLVCGSRLRSSLIVTTRAADGTLSLADLGGCQVTWASTRIAVSPPPALITSTTRSLVFSTPGTGGSENVSDSVCPNVESPAANWRGRRPFSQASTACGWPAASHHDVSSTSAVETG